MSQRFFTTSKTSFKRKEEILLLAKTKCSRWWFDELDCGKSYRRQRVYIDFDKAMEYFDDRAYFTMAHRSVDPENHLEIGFRASKNQDVDVFLWLILEPQLIGEFEALLEK